MANFYASACRRQRNKTKSYFLNIQIRGNVSSSSCKSSSGLCTKSDGSVTAWNYSDCARPRGRLKKQVFWQQAKICLNLSDFPGMKRANTKRVRIWRSQKAFLHDSRYWSFQMILITFLRKENPFYSVGSSYPRGEDPVSDQGVEQWMVNHFHCSQVEEYGKGFVTYLLTKTRN